MTDKTQEIVESLKGAVSRCSATGRVLVNATMLLEAKREIERLAHEADALLDALHQITEWPDGGNRYGQENIKRFAQAAIDAAMRKEDSND